jgi:hypothetical protein
VIQRRFRAEVRPIVVYLTISRRDVETVTVDAALIER